MSERTEVVVHTVQVFKGQGRIQNWYVRLVSSNGQTLAVSEGYVSKWNAMRAARRNHPGLRIVVVK